MHPALFLGSLFLGSLVLLCAAAPAQAARPDTRPAVNDWTKHVQKANQHRRLMLRQAAGRKVAQGGDAAIPAVRAFESKHGRNSMRMEFVWAYTRTHAKGKETLKLLEEWARDRNFYWRSQALMALANRKLEQHRPLFMDAVRDVAFLTRIQGGRGLFFLGHKEDQPLYVKLLRDEDPRVRVSVAATLVEGDNHLGLPILVEALRQDGEFLGDPWGARNADRAIKVLRKLGKWGLQRGASAKENAAAITKVRAFAKKSLAKAWQDPIPARSDKTNYLGGVEVRSCRNGDLFLRWTSDGKVVFGLESNAGATLPAETWKKLRDKLPAGSEGIRGKVVCDYLRLQDSGSKVHTKCAPGSLPADYSSWLRDLADSLKGTGHPQLASEITKRLGQFAPAN